MIQLGRTGVIRWLLRKCLFNTYDMCRQHVQFINRKQQATPSPALHPRVTRVLLVRSTVARSKGPGGKKGSDKITCMNYCWRCTMAFAQRKETRSRMKQLCISNCFEVCAKYKLYTGRNFTAPCCARALSYSGTRARKRLGDQQPALLEVRL